MPLVLMLIGGLASAAASLVGRVLISLAIGYVTYSGIDVALGWLRTEFLSTSSTLPSGVIGLLGVLKVGTSFSILSSAILARLTLNGLTSGKITKAVLK